MITVIKRNGSKVDFYEDKIINAIQKASNEVNSKNSIPSSKINTISKKLTDKYKNLGRSVHVEEIQDDVEMSLMEEGYYEIARKYIRYRYDHELKRKANTTDAAIISLIHQNNEEIKQENSNKNPAIISTQRDYMAGEVSKDLCERFIFEDEWEAHSNGLIHIHDTDYLAQEGIYNCCLINLEDMLNNGTVISGVKIEKPHSFTTACTIATQIIAQVASSQYGGQSVTLSHLAPFVDISRQKIKKDLLKEMQLINLELSDEEISTIVESRVAREIEQGIQTLQYQIITLQTTNGQAPFITIFMYINEVPEGQLREDLVLIIKETIKQRYIGVKNEQGVYITSAFPKLIYVLEENNIHEDSKYWDITKLSAQCTAKRLVPDYISEKIMMSLKEGNCFPPMGCRSCLTPWKDENGSYKFYGRFNKGVVTINLPDVALSSDGDINKFWEIFDKRLEICHKVLIKRYNQLKGTKSDVAPILWQYGAIARLNKGETIDKYLTGGYSTISLGYAGLYECVKYMTGESHTSETGKVLALDIMKHMNDKCVEWNNDLNIGFGIYGTPLESTTYKFAKCLQKRFGKIKGITDKNYITNSYHIHVTEEIDAFSKLLFESEFQSLSTGGAISYVEVPNMNNNIDGILEIMKFMYNNIMYSEINSKSDYCQNCGYDGEILIKETPDHNLIWECPCCGNTDESKMNVSRRTCGYIGSNFWNFGRTEEIKDRVLHVDN